MSNGRLIDMRSDTNTMPTAEMQRAMAAAELGDDVQGEDPTINRLQDKAAEVMGKEAALFLPSGTMGNLIGALVNAHSGEEVIADSESHFFLSETGGAAALGGIQIFPVRTERGILTRAQIVGAIRPNDKHYPRTAAVSLEDPHGFHGGIPWSVKELRDASDAAHEHGLSVHLNGARIFNSAIATGTSVRDRAAFADTIVFNLAKTSGSASWQHDMRFARQSRSGDALAKAARGWDAENWNARSGRDSRSGHDGGSPGGGSHQCPDARGRRG